MANTYIVCVCVHCTTQCKHIHCVCVSTLHHSMQTHTLCVCVYIAPLNIDAKHIHKTTTYIKDGKDIDETTPYITPLGSSKWIGIPMDAMRYRYGYRLADDSLHVTTPYMSRLDTCHDSIHVTTPYMSRLHSCHDSIHVTAANLQRRHT